MSQPRHLAARVAALAALCWFLFLPLRDILAFPERISVLPNLETDAAAYDASAREFARTWNIADLPSKHPPGWMVLLAAVYATVGHSYVAGKSVSWVALLITVALCAWLAHRAFGRTAALIAALLCASSQGLRAYVGTLQYEVLTGALFMVFLALSLRAADAASGREALIRAALAGGSGAALILTRETFVVVVMITAVWLWSQLRADERTDAIRSPRLIGALSAVVLLTVAAVPALAWSAAQTAHYQRLILISEKGPKEFQLGNNPLANGTYNEPLVGMGEPAGVDYIRAFPLDALQLAGRKVLYSFGVLRDGWNVPHPAAVWIWRATTGAVPLAAIEPVVAGGWLLIFFLIAIYVLGRAGWRRWWLLPVTVSAILAVHVITLASFRFSVPLLPALYVLASGPLALVVRAALPMLRSPVVALTCALVLIFAIAAQFESWPLEVSYDAAELEGIAATNQVDDVSGSLARLADAEQGTRPIALLPDTFFPAGSLRLTARLRMTHAAAYHATPVARVALVQLNGRPACIGDISAAQLRSDQFSEIAMLCELDRDGPATLAVFSLGQADLSVDTLRLAWVK